MRVISTPLDGVVLVEPDVFGDARGFFMESYHAEKFAAAGIHMNFVQDNHSLSEQAGTLRGLHYQLAPKAQTKLVRVLVGAIYDVAVDIRPESSTFGQWYGVILSAENKRQLLVPQGFAHGFCTIVPNTEVSYKVDQFYASAHDRGILWNDPALSIPWPTEHPHLSDKDQKHPVLAKAQLSLDAEG
ncbi:dTDP-4-dehydrorhamnose 3,5-epimerase [Paenibacillus selenitireducens]|uniref:dTDP-4-dehydrorhamnose 3,5-epimerase n=1 Tax=Paenibacillus selenitireducens TaxID=1324314 RepID=A0A1T2X2L4_9BACL|nr:dTDP-4-dehydrorhamnose 3,5-epimerase [Paenibacillus selenitireducens]OPA74100.1 dTDP-4-dehydrorhamnose 3,5-epimerase [Paenibacillus selenitireducens]